MCNEFNIIMNSIEVSHIDWRSFASTQDDRVWLY